jgi:two-component system phosphate regulon response regulator PhoB
MSPYRLLVIDDDESFLRVWGYILTQAGFSVTAVPNVEEAKAHLDTHTPDLIVCDVNLPGMDGVAFCEHLKKSPRTRNIPVVMISAYGDLAKRRMSQICGAKGYLEKPFCRCELFAVLSEALRERYGIEEGDNNGSRTEDSDN